MKKVISLSLLLIFASLFTAPRAQAQGYPARIVEVCPVCRQYVYAYYQPVNCNGLIHYNWVTARHTACLARPACVQPAYVHPHGHIHYAPAPFYGYPHYFSPYAGGYVRPGVSIRILR